MSLAIIAICSRLTAKMPCTGVTSDLYSMLVRGIDFNSLSGFTLKPDCGATSQSAARFLCGAACRTRTTGLQMDLKWTCLLRQIHSCLLSNRSGDLVKDAGKD